MDHPMLIRWREAICVMMIYDEPSMTNEELSKLGQKLANLFKQVRIKDTFLNSMLT